jgi:predicted phage tail protein
MRTIYLHGILAENFIDKIDLQVNSVPEVILALSANFSGFKEFLINYTPGFFIKVDDEYKDKDSVSLPILSTSSIHIIPSIAGSGKAGLIIGGLILIAMTGGFASFGIGGILPGTAVAATGTTAAVAASGMSAIIGQIGIGLVMAGISALLYSPPKTAKSTTQEANTYFNGAVNTIKQGGPVPVGYGELIIGSAVISAGITVTQTGEVDYNWFWKIDGSNGWSLTTDKNGNYSNPSKNLFYNPIKNTYQWVTKVYHYNIIETGLVGGKVTTAKGLQSIETTTYEYREDINRFFLVDNPSVFTFNTKYSSLGGSADLPKNWGTVQDTTIIDSDINSWCCQG